MKKKTTSNFFILLGIALISIFLLTACSNSEETDINGVETDEASGASENGEEGEPTIGGTITIGVNGEPDTLDLHKTGLIVASTIGSHLGGGLLTRNPATREIGPYLAQSYEISEDGLTYTFTLQPDITFHDGTELTAQSFKDTFDRALNPDTNSVATGTFLNGVKEITVVDELSLVIELEEPLATILLSLTLDSYLQPLSMDAINEYGADYGQNPVGVGPWKFNEWITGQSVSLIRNEDYAWPQSYYDNKGSAYPDELEYKFITDYQTRLSALDSGSIDIAPYIQAKDVQRYRDHKDFNVLEAEREGLGLFLEMNLEHDILQDVNVRKALNMAIDKKALIEATIDGEGVEAYGPISETIFGYDPEVENYGHKYNQEEAMSLIESAGWSKNDVGMMEKDGEVLKLELLTSQEYGQGGQIVQAMLKEIGIEVNIQSMESATLVEKMVGGEYELSFLDYEYNDPDVMYLLFHSTQVGGLNISRTNNPELDELLERGRAEADQEKRKEIYAAAQRIIVEEAYLIPIYVEKIFHVINKKVHGVKTFNSELLLHDSWIDE